MANRACISPPADCTVTPSRSCRTEDTGVEVRIVRETAFVDVRNVHDRLCRDQVQLPQNLSLIFVKIKRANGKALGEVVMTRSIGGADVPVVLVSQHTYDGVYEGVPAGAERLEPGSYVRLVNAELIIGFWNPFFVVIITPLVVWFFASRVKAGVSTASSAAPIPTAAAIPRKPIWRRRWISAGPMLQTPGW